MPLQTVWHVLVALLSPKLDFVRRDALAMLSQHLLSLDALEASASHTSLGQELASSRAEARILSSVHSVFVELARLVFHAQPDRAADAGSANMFTSLIQGSERSSLSFGTVSVCEHQGTTPSLLTQCVASAWQL